MSMHRFSSKNAPRHWSASSSPSAKRLLKSPTSLSSIRCSEFGDNLDEKEDKHSVSWPKNVTLKYIQYILRIVHLKTIEICLYFLTRANDIKNTG